MKGDRRMTIRELLARVDTIRPNAYTDGEKIAMLNTIEGRIYRENGRYYAGGSGTGHG